MSDDPPSDCSFAEDNPNPVLQFDASGGLRYANASAHAMAQSLGRKELTEIFPPDLPRYIKQCLETPAPAQVRVDSTAGKRTFAWRFFRGHPGNTVHCQVTDTSELQQLEAQLRHAQKLDSVGRLAAGIAHDFNNVLTIIKGHTGLLRSDPTAVNPALRDSVQQIAQAAERGSKLTNQLLSFSRRNVLRLRPIDLNELITNLSAMLHRTLGEDVTCQFRYASDLPRIHADPALIEQVVLNLAVNAREAMPKGGQLVVSSSVVEIDAAYVQRHPTDAKPGQFVCLTVSDTGCGMDAATLSRVFEPFFTTRDSGEGRGLGLATAYGIVKQHHGWIEIRSQPGQGSTFRVFLPPTQLRPTDELTIPHEQVPRGTETILVVEDEAPVRWILKEALGKLGYTVLEAGNGVEALALWHQHHATIRLLLTDMVMPVGLTGQELAERFTNQEPDLKVMYMSGYSLQAAGKDIPLLDGLNFLAKPFDGARLALAIRQCLDS
jgi:signal transduction histidine kinase/CheY-like chemotaxis protein